MLVVAFATRRRGSGPDLLRRCRACPRRRRRTRVVWRVCCRALRGCGDTSAAVRSQQSSARRRGRSSWVGKELVGWPQQQSDAGGLEGAHVVVSARWHCRAAPALLPGLRVRRMAHQALANDPQEELMVGGAPLSSSLAPSEPTASRHYRTRVERRRQVAAMVGASSTRTPSMEKGPAEVRTRVPGEGRGSEAGRQSSGSQAHQAGR